MKKIILLSLILIFSNCVNAENIYSGLKYLEKKLFDETYEYQLPETRLERLETKMFGTCQSGTFEDRYYLLKNASKNYKAYSPNRQQVYNQYRPPVFTGTSGSGWRNTLFGNFMNQFAGYPTGYTPTITPAMDPAYMDYFEAERAMARDNGYYTHYRTPRGYYLNRINRGAKTGVTILD